jgi:hypothetical protein
MIYTKDWAFIHIPKTSGMNLKINAFNRLKETIIKPYEDTNVGYVYMHNPYSYWEYALQNKWVFSIVRNPFSRAVSLWKFCNEKKENFKKKFGYVEFYDFYINTSLKTLEGLTWGLHTPQHDFIKNKNGEIAVDVFKMENELHLLEEKLNFRFINTRYNSFEKYDYKTIYKDNKNKRIVQEMYESDFVAFNYDIDTL